MDPAAEGALRELDAGIAAMDAGRYAEALAAFERAVDLRPTARALNNAGIALMALDRHEEAVRAFERALAQNPRYALASFNLARLAAPFDAEKAYRHVQAAVQADPTNAEAWLLLADLLRGRRDAANAMRAINLAIERSPQRPSGWNARANLLSEQDQSDAARNEYAAAWTRFPADLRSALGACLTLPHVYTSHEHLVESRANFAAGLERLHEAADRFRFIDAENALAASRWTNFYLAYQGRNDRELQARFGAFQRRVLEAAAPELFQPPMRRRAAGRVRVGFLSYYFYNCVVGRYFGAWIRQLDASRFESHVYYTNGWIADDTRAIAAAAGHFHHMAGRPLAAIARQIIADDLDVLVYPEVGMHQDIVTLSALRLAPVQCMAWGHPTTSGSTQMDWYLSCEAMEGADAQSHYVERLALLPGLGTRYERPALQGEARRDEFGLPADRNLYLAPQSLFKLHPDNDALVAGVLAADPEGLAVMFEANREASTRTFRARLDAALAAAGVAPDRVRMLKPDLQHAAYVRLNAACDVMLDSLHWSGGNTSIDAISAGLPVVTLPGELMRGRQTAAMLGTLGLPGLVVADREAYVREAVALGRDRERRREVSARMLAGHEALFGRDEPIRALEDFLERVARAD